MNMFPRLGLWLAFLGAGMTSGPMLANPAPKHVVVDTLIQNQEESSIDFLARTSAVLRHLTQTTGHEFGGRLCSDPQGKLGTFITTSEQRMFVYTLDGCPLETPNTLGYIIHSHPEPGLSISFVLRDREMRGSRYKKQVNYMSSKGQRRFSKADYSLGSGFLVAGRYLIYQQGPGTECVVLDLDDASLPPTRLSATGKVLPGQECVAPPPRL